MEFKDLAAGSRFRFCGELDFPHSGMASGPWVKTSELRYDHATSGQTNFRVGSKRVKVEQVA